MGGDAVRIGQRLIATATAGVLVLSVPSGHAIGWNGQRMYGAMHTDTEVRRWERGEVGHVPCGSSSLRARS